MALPDLTGQNIQDTYQRVVQTDGSLLYNGTGSLITILPTTASHAVSASYAVSASHEIIKEVSSSFADTASYVNPLNQDVFITGSTNISGSTTLSNSDLILVADPSEWDSGNIGGELKLTRLNSSRVAVRIGRTSTGNGDDGEIEIFRDGVSRFKFTGNGNNYINPTGLGSNVGIGTTSPSEKLQVNGNIAISGSNATLQLREGSAELYKFTAGGTSLDMTVNSTNALSIFQNGYVGIGTDSPQGLFHVSGSGKILLGTGGGSPTEGCFEFTPAGSVDFKFKNSAGDRGVVIKTNNGSVGGSIGSKIYGAAGGITLEGAFGQENLSLTTDGKVGINNTSPQQLLDITDTTAAPVLRLSRNQNIGGTSWAGESLGDIEFYTNDPSNPRVYGKISVVGGPDSGTPNVGYPDGHLVFETAGQQGGLLSEKMRITDDGKVGIGTTSPDASAILDIASTSKGVVFPRMTSAQRTAISSPTTGLIVYQTDSTEGLYIYKSTGWVQII